MTDIADPAALLDAACRDLERVVELLGRARAEDLAAANAPLARAAEQLRSALAAIALAPPSRRPGFRGDLERFRRELRTGSILYARIGTFCGGWMSARSGPGRQVYSPRGGWTFTPPGRTARRICVEG